MLEGIRLLLLRGCCAFALPESAHELHSGVGAPVGCWLRCDVLCSACQLVASSLNGVVEAAIAAFFHHFRVIAPALYVGVRLLHQVSLAFLAGKHINVHFPCYSLVNSLKGSIFEGLGDVHERKLCGHSSWGGLPVAQPNSPGGCRFFHRWLIVG